MSLGQKTGVFVHAACTFQAFAYLRTLLLHRQASLCSACYGNEHLLFLSRSPLSTHRVSN